MNTEQEAPAQPAQGAPEARRYQYHVESDWPDMHAALDRGERCHVDEAFFDYYMGVLPPKFMGRVVPLCDGTNVWAHFGFAEGAEPIVAWWYDRDGRHFAQRTTWIARG